MAENKTQITKVTASDFLAQVKNDRRREDGQVLLKLMKKVTGKQAKMWGPSIIGFDQYHYKYESGREGDICMIGFSPRSQSLVLYLLNGFKEYEALKNKLGKFKTSKACIYINKLADIDMDVLEELISKSYAYGKSKYG